MRGLSRVKIDKSKEGAWYADRVGEEFTAELTTSQFDANRKVFRVWMDGKLTGKEIDPDYATVMEEALTDKEINEYVALGAKIEQRVHMVLAHKSLAETGKTYRGEIEKIEFENGAVDITCLESSHCSCCRDENFYYSFPIEYLTDIAYLDKVREEVRKREEKAAREKEKQEAERLESIRQRELATLAELKTKYEPKQEEKEVCWNCHDVEKTVTAEGMCYDCRVAWRS